MKQISFAKTCSTLLQKGVRVSPPVYRLDDPSQRSDSPSHPFGHTYNLPHSIIPIHWPFKCEEFNSIFRAIVM